MIDMTCKNTPNLVEMWYGLYFWNCRLQEISLIADPKACASRQA